MRKLLRIAVIMVFLATTGISARDYQYVSPVPGSVNNSRETTIIIREGTNINPGSLYRRDLIRVTGTLSGTIAGKIILSSDRKTIIFKADDRFRPGETVSVSLASGIRTVDGRRLSGMNFSFDITPLPERLDPGLYLDYDDFDFSTGTSFRQSPVDTVPANFPSITTEVTGETAPGYVFLTVSRDIPEVGYYIMMLDNSGEPFYYKELPDDYAYDFKMQPNGLFSYAQFIEHHSYTGGGNVVHMVMDNSFAVIDSFQAGNGYVAEAHDFQMLPNGHVLLFCYDLQLMDLTHLGGYPNALVAGTVVQELDANKNVVFQWRSWDHYELTDSYNSNWNRPALDPIHVNSIELDSDGHILITPNGLSEVTKISRQTGEIIWRLGGKNNQFTWVGANAEFARGIHNVDRLPGGTITLFDNTPVGSSMSSRAVEYEVDETNLTATLVWEYVPDPAILGVRRGSAQRLPNGNTIIGWGSASDGDSLAVTEVTPNGEVVFQLRFNHTGLSSYRAFRFPFTDGAPFAEDTELEVTAGATYSFSQGDTLDTGLNIFINSLGGVGYNELTVSRYEFAPFEPQFSGKAPRVVPKRIVLSQFGIAGINADLRFDADAFGINDPENIVVYHREFEGQGLFLPLSTIYNSVTGEIIATTTQFGEFILTRPEPASLIFSPVPFAPADSALVNQNLPLNLRWTPTGYVNYYSLQVAGDPAFTNPIVDETFLTEALYEMSSLDPESDYFWRVKSFNDAGESDWSETFIFTATAPFVTVTVPNGGDMWQRGLPHFVRWADNLGEDVIVELLRNDTLFSILDTTLSNGGYRWDIDPNLSTGDDYRIKVRSVANDTYFDLSDQPFSIIDTVTLAINGPETAASGYQLYQNYPNPFNPETVISYRLTVVTEVELAVFNLLGQKVATLYAGRQTAGVHQAVWDGRDEYGRPVASGVYFYKLATPAFTRARKMVLMQ